MKLLRVPIALVSVVLIYIFRLALLAVGSVVYLYLLPGVLASHREHPKTRRIYWVCAVSAWLIVPWLICLFLVLYSPKPDETGSSLAYRR